MHAQTSAPLLEMRGITKAFPGVQALADVDLVAYPGEVHAIVGENGAGKSTLMKILAGAQAADSGELLFDGHHIPPGDPAAAQLAGIGMVYQELSLFPELSIAENVLAGRHPTRLLGWVDWPELLRRVAATLQVLDLALDPTTAVRHLSVGQQQLVEIARVYALAPRLIVMDEPTSSLTEHETLTLFGAIRSLRAQGIAVLYISHRLSEVLEIADRVTVLRDGRRVGSAPAAELTSHDLVQMMVGREIGELFPKQDAEIADPVLEVRGLYREGVFSNIDLTVRRGEIVGLAGLVGAGRTEIARALVGLDPIDAGEIRVDGQAVDVRTVRAAFAAGLAYVPEDRKQDGLVLGMTARENLSLAALPSLARLGVISPRRERSLARKSFERLNIRPPHIEREARTFSGGNQQKIVIGKCLATRPRVLILDEPTRGIDVGAKAEVHELIGELVQQGVGVLLISSELPEILSASDRVIVIHQGRVTAELGRTEATEHRVMLAATGAAA